MAHNVGHLEYEYPDDPDSNNWRYTIKPDIPDSNIYIPNFITEDNRINFSFDRKY